MIPFLCTAAGMMPILHCERIQNSMLLLAAKCHLNLTHLLGRNDAWAIRADQAALGLASEGVLHADHVVLWNTFSNADNQRHFGLDRLEDGSGRSRRRDVDHGRVGFGRVFRLAHCAENGQAEVLLAGLRRRDTSDDLRAIVERLLAVERSLLSRESLHNHFRVRSQAQVAPCRFI